MMHWNTGWYMGGIGVAWLLALAAVGVSIWFIVVYFRRSSGWIDESPERILKRRFARGEIDGVTYHRMLTELRA